LEGEQRSSDHLFSHYTEPLNDSCAKGYFIKYTLLLLLILILLMSSGFPCILENLENNIHFPGPGNVLEKILPVKKST